MTERVYYTDSYTKSFRAQVLDGGSRVVLDRTAFYPSSGGQPHDLGTIGEADVQEVVEEDGRIVHLLSKPVAAGEVECRVDWARRLDYMQQHTGQHLLSAVFADLFGLATVSFHMGAEASTIDLACGAVSPAQIEAAEARANAIVQENRQVHVEFEDAESAAGLRKATERSGRLRIVNIENLDRSACGGTHVRSTGEIGLILLRSVEKIRSNIRLEFLCGGRAVRRARADYAALESAARILSASTDEVPALVAAQVDRLKETGKAQKRLETELGELRGRALHAATEPAANGNRWHVRTVSEGPFGDDLRSEANGFIAAGHAVFAAVSLRPPALLLASSADSGVHAGEVLKQALAEFGGKGGGSAIFAQGSFSGDPESLLAWLRQRTGH